MATWIAHLRIAENLLKKGYNFEPKPFVVGNIGPDSNDIKNNRNKLLLNTKSHLEHMLSLMNLNHK